MFDTGKLGDTYFFTMEYVHGENVRDVLKPGGKLLVLQPNVVTPDRRHGVQTGELVVVTADGARSLHAAPRGLLQAGVA